MKEPKSPGLKSRPTFFCHDCGQETRNAHKVRYSNFIVCQRCAYQRAMIDGRE
jgi:formylmethanofuran dehydrogenase subunit E